MNAVELSRITKRFAGVAANEDINFTAKAGEVHALLGENGAGKSTLMSVLAGLYRPDAGVIYINGNRALLRSPGDAIARGVGMVYQHFMLVDSFTVTENVLLGQRKRQSAKAAAKRIAELGARYGLRVDPAARIWQLSIGEQQRVEILRLLERGARILVFDEPTAVLTPQEAAELIGTLRAMAAEGFCIIFISHKLDEVLAVADRITVLRRGRVAATVEAAAATPQSLARLMVGREIGQPGGNGGPPAESRPMLEISGLHALGDTGLPALSGLYLSVRQGEIVGIAGVAGNGQRELAEVITGLRPARAGRVLLAGADLLGLSPRQIVERGVAHIPEDRSRTGLIGGLSLSDNLILKEYRRPALRRGPFLDRAAIDEFADRLISAHGIVAPNHELRAGLLSGGNQQRLLVARELAGAPRLLVAVHPTRGVDIGASEAIHRLLLEQRRLRDTAILLIAEDLDELLALADRVAVIYEGRIMGIVEAARADRDQLGLLMAGGAREPA